MHLSDIDRDQEKEESKQWKRSKYLADLFANRWTNEEVCLYQERQKWTKRRPNLKAQDLVLMVDDLTHRSHWKLVRVLEVKTSGDDLVRSAS